MNDFLGKVNTNEDLRDYVGDLNIVECFEKCCFEHYGGYEGTTNRLSQQEGTVRHQSCFSSPVSLHENQRSIRSLVRTLGLFSSGPFNHTRYIQLFKQVKDDVIFLGDLKAQKAIMTFASLGLFIPQNYLEYSYNSRNGAFGRVLSYDGQTLSRSEDVGHRFDPFFIQTPFPPMPCAFGEVGCNIGSSKHHEKAPGRPLPWCHRGQPLFRERRVVGQRAPPPLI